MEEKIVAQLREDFDPAAIILHGSRASGHERTHSDWDFILLYSERATQPANGRVLHEGENIELSHHVLPIADVMKEFSVKLQNARLVYETKSIGTEVLSRAQAACCKPLGWTSEEKYSHSLWMRGRIDGMKDTRSEPLLFEKYAADFYSRITNYWYWAIHDSYPKPIYLALEEIAGIDPEYLTLIERFVEDNRSSKVEIAEEIFTRCFR